jgi:predicted DNA-binding transcriptional regulator AlpA
MVVSRKVRVVEIVKLLGEAAVGYTNTLITVRQAAEMLGLSPKTLYAGKAGTEKLRRIRNGKRAVRMVRQEVEAHLQRLMSPDKLMTEIRIEKASEQ